MSYYALFGLYISIAELSWNSFGEFTIPKSAYFSNNGLWVMSSDPEFKMVHFSSCLFKAPLTTSPFCSYWTAGGSLLVGRTMAKTQDEFLPNTAGSSWKHTVVDSDILTGLLYFFYIHILWKRQNVTESVPIFRAKT